MQKVSKPRQTNSATKASEQVTNEVEINTSSEPQYFDIEHTYSGNPSQWKRKLDEKENLLENCRKKLKNTQKRENTAKKKCEHYIEQLYQLNLLNEELRHELASYGDIPCGLFQRPSKEYNEEQRNFALTLHLYSPKAYSYLRSINVQLPHPRTLRRWLQSIDAKPGINIAMLEGLKTKRLQSPESYTRCCLMLDAMHIRQHIDFDSKNGTHIGYVDLGLNVKNESLKQAKEVLVIMLVGLAGKWKAPVGYFFTAGLSAETQKEIVLHAIDAVEDYGFFIHGLTMDGHPTNVSMCRLLGANLNIESNQFCTWFVSGQGNKIFIFFDACHMLKLMRNTLQGYGALKFQNNIISWNYVKELHEVQEVAGVHLANKVSTRHIQFQQQKMKVSLATQVLSSSVASALRTMKSIDSRFIDCCSTADFIERMDKLFDIMNSRSPADKGYKSPLSLANISQTTDFLLEMKNYLLKLQVMDGMLLHKSKRGMCVLGFVTLIESVLGLANHIIPTQKYLLTYKLSQDHLEILFSAIRRACGWNNNPTAKTFMGVFRKIISHCGAVKASPEANCQAQDDTELVQMTTTTYMPPTSNPEDENDPFESSFLFHDHDYDMQRLSPIIENTIVYVAGWVVRRIMPSIACMKCRMSLVIDIPDPKYKNSYTLLELKQKGGLLLPSNDCVLIVMTAEKVLRHLTNVQQVNQKVKLLQVQSAVVAQTGNVVFSEHHRQETQELLDNHVLSLIRSIVAVFFALRQHHMTKLHNIRHKGMSTRHVANRSVIFKGH